MNTDWLMATVIPPGASEEVGDAEMVVYEVDPLAITLTLDTGERIVIERQALQLALSGQPGLRVAS